MFKACRRACAVAALGVFMAAGSSAANAITLNIIDYIDNGATGVGEQAVDSGIGGYVTNTLSIPNSVPGPTPVGVNLTGALVSDPGGANETITTNGIYAYLDGGGAGAGVCSGGITASAQCSTASDDNVGKGGGGVEVTEILYVSFDQDWSLDQLLFRDEGHETDFYNNNNAAGTKYVSIDIGGGGFNEFELEDTGDADGGISAIGASLVDWSATVVSAGTVVSLKNFNQQFYLAGLLLSQPPGQTVIPLPAGLVLLLSGLLGLGAVGRFRKKVA